MIRVNTDNAQYQGTYTDIVRSTRSAAVNNPAPIAAAVASGHAAAEQQPSPEQLKAAVDSVNEAIKSRNAQIQFEIDDKTAQIITRIVDKSTGELIRQIPTEEVVRIARAMADKPAGSDSVPLVRASA